MPAWLIPYWITDMLMTLGLVLIGVGSAGLALTWLRTRLGGGISKASLRSGRPIPTALETGVVQDQKEDQHRAEVGGSYFSEK